MLLYLNCVSKYRVISCFLGLACYEQKVKGIYLKNQYVDVKLDYLEQIFYILMLRIFLPASPKAKAGVGVQTLRPSVRPSQNLVIATETTDLTRYKL